MNLKEIFISDQITVKEALKKLDLTAEKVLIVVDDKRKLIGALSDGDIRRYLLKGKGLDSSVEKIINRNPKFLLKDEYSLENARNILLQNKIPLFPIVDKSLKVIDFMTWEKAFKSAYDPSQLLKKKINIPVIIMAGGKGSRMEPFTRVLPKPLIPIGDKTIIEHIMEGFGRYGISKYYLTLNYKGEMIVAFFNGIENKSKIEYVWEKQFLGTAGSLKLLKKNTAKTFIVSNCDIIVKADYSDALQSHKKSKAAITIISSIQHFKIPYGVIQFTDGGTVTSITEKPEYTSNINTGVYILNEEVISLIPENKYFDMPQLIEAAMAKGMMVKVYPVNEKDYIDIGQWEEYKNALELFKA